MTTTNPVVLIYIDGDSYGADPVCFAGTGMPEVIVFDGGRYDKYNWDEGNDPPRMSHAEDLAKLAGHEAHDTLLEWVEQAESSLGILSPEELAERFCEEMNEHDDIERAVNEIDGLEEEEIMGEHSCLPPGDPDCDVLDLCNGYRLVRPARPGNWKTPDEIRNAPRVWTVHKYR